MSAEDLNRLNRQIVECRRCPRLVGYRELVARVKRRAFQGETYWGRPLPGFGELHARLLIVGLAPAAHGGNRTGRMFTGDDSGDFLFAALHRAGLANQAVSRARDDGLKLSDAYITAVVRCAPPGNRPLPEEILDCREYLDREFAILNDTRVIVTLGHVAFDNCLAALERRGTALPRPRPAFGHNRLYQLTPEIILIASYHPSRRNTQTGMLRPRMFDRVFAQARAALGGKARA